jgi:hypothetical protein
MLCSIDWYFFCEVPVCATQHPRRANTSAAARQKPKIFQEHNYVVYGSELFIFYDSNNLAEHSSQLQAYA